ncbi:MAG: hypothetical protein EOO48_05440 [Flavobacterium sp.]|nr:MAG: hypothetical protein EOO48_05440 [Flavobacterium sp.]
MKKLLLLLVLPLFLGCQNESFNNNNPYIPNYPFSVQLDMALPAYSQLQYVSNAYFYGGADGGVRGIIIFNTGSGYNAYDAACPNQELSACSTMGINGIYAHCPCDDANYSLFSGQAPGKQYPMKQYRVSKSGTLLTIYN